MFCISPSLSIIAKNSSFLSQGMEPALHSIQENKSAEILEDKFPAKLSNFFIMRISCLVFFKFNENK